MTVVSNGSRERATPDCYSRLYEDLVQGRLRAGERLVELDLAHRLGVGRASVRTALARLAHEGLVELVPNRGARVRVVGDEEAIEIYEARAMLEALAARCAARKAGRADVVRLRAIHKQMTRCHAKGDLPGMSDLNAQLHAEILRIANHQTVSQLIETLRARHLRFQFRTILVPGRAEQSLAEHAALVEAVAAKDPAAAESAMRLHIQHVTEALRKSSGLTSHSLA